MHPAAQIAWVVALAALFAVFAARAGWLWLAAPVGVDEPQGPGLPDEGGDEEQKPETDRAPRRALHALTYAVAITAAVRLGLLVTLHR
ncbi:MAG TPA: hypothetical protein VKC58_07410 [Myxococcales bacterium]|jgi:hypothetical protein|nr:hypothetical protein [Myxococcales bacterium]